jgi:polygalacturonase
MLLPPLVHANGRVVAEHQTEGEGKEAIAVDVSSAEHVKPALPVIPARTFTLTDFGAIADGKTTNTEAFKAAIAAVEKAGGGKLVVPRGVFRTGPFSLCSSLDLHLEAGAIIQALDTFAALGLPDPASLTTQAEADSAFRPARPLIGGERLHDVALTGPGTIDGNGQHWWDWSERAAQHQHGRLFIRRPHLIAMRGVTRLHVADLTLSNSSMFHLVPSDVTDLTIERVKIRAPYNAPNTDAIDPGPGSRFWIHDCDIDTGDDDIVIKSGGSDILIENNTIRHGHGISIGSPTANGVHNMLVRNCTFEGTVVGIRIKSMRGAGGLVENIRYTDIRMTNVENAIVLQLDYSDGNRPNFRGDPSKIPTIRNVLLDHLTIARSRNAAIIHGLPESRIIRVTVRDSTITAENDFEVRNADPPQCERVTKTIAAGIAPASVPDWITPPVALPVPGAPAR